MTNYLRGLSRTKYNNESYKEWCIRQLMEVAEELQLDSLREQEYDSRISAINYVIGYLIGIGWRND